MYTIPRHSPLFLEIAEQTRRLHELMRREDGDQADALRQSIYDGTTQLSREEQEQLKGLAGDLYMLVDEELVERIETDEMKRKATNELQCSVTSSNWRRVLSLLRLDIPVPQPYKAFWRARAWESFGDPCTALCFIRHACQIEPTNATFRQYEIHLTVKSGGIVDALRECNSVCNTTPVHARLLYKAADVFFEAAKTAEGRGRSELLQRVIQCVNRALAETNDNFKETLESVIAGGYVAKGMAHEELGEFDDAEQTYNAAIQRKPSAELLLARGLNRLCSGHESDGIRDLEASLPLNPKTVWPYYYLARHKLLASQYNDVIALCCAALEFRPPNKVACQLYEWLAISQYQTFAPQETVLNNMRTAAALDPANEVVSRNLATLVQTLTNAPLSEPPISPSSFQVPPAEAARQNRLGHEMAEAA